MSEIASVSGPPNLFYHIVFVCSVINYFPVAATCNFERCDLGFTAKSMRPYNKMYLCQLLILE